MPPDAASPSSTRFVRAGVIASVVLVFAVTIAAVTLWLRGEMHAQIQQREAESIAATVAMQLDDNVRDLPATTPVSEVPGMLLVTVLDSMTRLRVAGDNAGSPEHEQIIGLRVFDAEAKAKAAASQKPNIWQRLDSASLHKSRNHGTVCTNPFPPCIAGRSCRHSSFSSCS